VSEKKGPLGKTREPATSNKKGGLYKVEKGDVGGEKKLLPTKKKNSRNVRPNAGAYPSLRGEGESWGERKIRAKKCIVPKKAKKTPRLNRTLRKAGRSSKKQKKKKREQASAVRKFLLNSPERGFAPKVARKEPPLVSGNWILGGEKKQGNRCRIRKRSNAQGTKPRWGAKKAGRKTGLSTENLYDRRRMPGSPAKRTLRVKKRKKA